MLDPLQFWRDALSNWEGSANSLANKEMSSEESVRAMQAVMSVAMALQQALGKANGVLLKELNLPSRSDIVEIGARLQRIEEMLEQLSHRLGDPAVSAPGPARGAMPPRTRKPAPVVAPASALASPAAAREASPATTPASRGRGGSGTASPAAVAKAAAVRQRSTRRKA
ncbi:hypothetical protein C7T35_03565 [Variovorax sp. WS11]|nr:hypothetical protein [Variovorax sp. WS11]PSL86085.1 hypothetical protein C7T35_03565 [Variovorax sp. WS11]